MAFVIGAAPLHVFRVSFPLLNKALFVYEQIVFHTFYHMSVVEVAPQARPKTTGKVSPILFVSSCFFSSCLLLSFSSFYLFFLASSSSRLLFFFFRLLLGTRSLPNLLRQVMNSFTSKPCDIEIAPSRRSVSRRTVVDEDVSN